MFEEEGGEDDSYGTNSMDLADLEDMEEAMEEEELEEDKVLLLTPWLASLSLVLHQAAQLKLVALCFLQLL